MRRMGRVIIAAALPLVAGAAAAQAQLRGIPVYFNPRVGTGVSVAANLGFPDYNAGGGTAYGAAGSFGTGPLALTGLAGVFRNVNSLGTQTWFGGTVAYRVFGGGLLPMAVALQAGYGATTSGTSSDASSVLIPVGVGIAFNPPLFPLKPWIAPRMEFTRAEGSTGQFRLSGGVNFDLRHGFGVHAAEDWGFGGGAWTRGAIWGVGAHFNLHVPTV